MIVSHKKWIVSFLIGVAATLLLLSGAAYLVDPFFQFRVKDNTYVLKAWVNSSGLVENYDYDTLIVGSSLTQNFNMSLFREYFGCEPLHVGLGAVRPAEVLELMNVAYDARKADRYFVCVDFYFFTNVPKENRFPRYVMKKDVLSRFRYFLSFEAWFRFIPVDVGLMLADEMNVKMPKKSLVYQRSIDWMNNWGVFYTPKSKSEMTEIIKQAYRRELTAYEMPSDETECYAEMAFRADDFLGRFTFENGEHIFFFPPYSSAYWCSKQDAGLFEPYLRAKEHFIKKAAEYGATVYDFQSADFTMNIENYKDLSHYLPKFNDWMVECFATGDYLVTEENAPAFREKLIENTNRFRKENEELFR